MRRLQKVLLAFLFCSAAAGAQANTAPPGWFDGDPLTEKALSGIWWLKVPFILQNQDDGIAVIDRETGFGTKYFRFGPNGILFRSTLSLTEPVSAVGVWQLDEDKILLTFSDVRFELTYYQVRDDRILVAGHASKGNEKRAVVGLLSRIREVQLEPPMEE